MASDVNASRIPAPLLTKSEIAEYINCSERTIDRWVKECDFPHIRLPSGHLRYRRHEVDRWIQEHGTPHPGPPREKK